MRGLSGRMAKPITIQVRPRPGAPLEPREIPAEVFGRWAVHADPYLAPTHTSYSVTHIPSGLAAAEGTDKGTAVRLAEIFAALLDVEIWDHAVHTPIAQREMRRLGWT